MRNFQGNRQERAFQFPSDSGSGRHKFICRQGPAKGENIMLQQQRGTKRFSVTVLAVLCLALVGFVWMTSSKAADDGIPGLSKNADGAYMITSAADLAAFRDAVNNSNDQYGSANAVLTANIDLGGKEWTPIGVFSVDIVNNVEDDPTVIDESKSYSGVFDGQGYSIEGLYISSDAAGKGLFARISGDAAAVQNLSVQGSVTAFGIAGLVAGMIDAGSIINCRASGDVFANGYSSNGKTDNQFAGRIAGGIVGSAGSSALVSNCSAFGSMKGFEMIGGIAGGSNGVVTGCLASCDVAGKTQSGVIVGGNYGELKNCAAYGRVTGNNCIGGICGEACPSSVGNVDFCVANCISFADVMGIAYTDAQYQKDSIGGVVGYSETTIRHCVAVGSVSGDTKVGRIAGSVSGDVIANCGWLKTSGGNASQDIGYYYAGYYATSSDITSFDQAALDAGKIVVACLPQDLTLAAGSTAALKFVTYPCASPDAVTPVSVTVEPSKLATATVDGKTISVKGLTSGAGVLTTSFDFRPTWFQTNGNVDSASTDVELEAASMLTVTGTAPVPGGSGGCNAGFAALALLAAPFVVRSKKHK